MIFPPPIELTFHGVFDAGVPNRERLVLQPNVSVNMAQFGILVGWKNPNGHVTPIWDNFFWFGEAIISPPMWIVVMTRGGQFEATKHPTTGEPMHVCFWGRKQTVFENPNVVPVLFQIGTLQIGNKALPQALPQSG